MVDSESLHFSDDFDVFEHGGGNDIVEHDVFLKDCHAVVKESTLNDFLVEFSEELLSEGPRGVSILNQDSFQNFDGVEFRSFVLFEVSEEDDQGLEDFAFDCLGEEGLNVLYHILHFAERV